MIKRLLSFFCLLLLCAQSSQAQSNALSFDGVNDRVTGTLPAAFNDLGATDITIEAWVKPQSVGAFQRVCFAQASTTQLMTLAINTGGTVYGYVVNAGTTYSQATSAPAVAAGQWTHLAVTWQAATGTVQLYANGVLQTGASGGSTSAASSGVFAIGARTDGAQPFNGVIDELRVWDTVRSAADIGADMSTAPVLTDPALLSYFPFDQGVADGNNTGLTTLVNLKNTDLNGTLSNFALNGAASNWVAGQPVTGAANHSLAFDGSNDRVTGTLPAVFNDLGATDITIEAWIKPQSISTFQRVCFAQASTTQLMTLAVGAGGQVYGYVVAGAGRYSLLTATPVLTAGQWTHLAFTWQAATGTVQLYANGVLQSGTSGGSTSAASSGVFAIGARTDGAQPFAGVIDELRVWNTIRSAADITSDMAAAPVLTDPALVSYYTFNQGVAGGDNAGLTTLVNLKNTDLNGTLSNFALNGAASNWVAELPTILPVELLVFSATPRAGQVILGWATAMEKNNARYELSRSTDGVHFQRLGTVAGAGNTTSRRSYAFTDHAPAPGLNYYRLEQIDLDGTVALLGIRSATIQPALVPLRAYPNPATDLLSVEVPPQADQKIQLTDLSGRLYQTMPLMAGQTTATLSLAGLPQGTYLLTLRGPAQVLVTKVVKR